VVDGASLLTLLCEGLNIVRIFFFSTLLEWSITGSSDASSLVASVLEEGSFLVRLCFQIVHQIYRNINHHA